MLRTISLGSTVDSSRDGSVLELKESSKIHIGEEIEEITRAQECKARSHGSMESEELAENRRPGKLGP